MKRYLLLLLLLASFSASAQQLPPYESTRQNQVLSDRAAQAKFFLALPSADVFRMPAYVPDSIKAKGVWIKTGTSRGLYIYNPATGLLEKVGKDYTDSLAALKANDASVVHKIDSTGAIGYQTIGNLFPKGDTRYYTKAQVDGAVAANSVQPFYYTSAGTEGNNFTSSTLVNVTPVKVSRSGIEYYPTVSTSPTGNQYHYTAGTGNFAFQDALNVENLVIGYKLTNTALSSYIASQPQFKQVASYTEMIGNVTSGWQEFLVTTDTVNGGGLPTRYLYFNGTQISYIIQ